MEHPLLNLLILLGLGFLGLYIVVRGYSRRSSDVLDDLRDEKLFVRDILEVKAEEEEEQLQENKAKLKKSSKESENDSLLKAGVFDPEERKKIILWNNLIPIVVGIVALIFSVMGGLTAAGTFLLVSIGMGAGAIYGRRRVGRLKSGYNRDLIFYLPIVMERIVMAVQAGLDIIPAIKTATRFGGEGKKSDPVTGLLNRAISLTESGMVFELALRDVASEVESSPLRHAFLHLAVAQKEGGVLIMPLRELSDSTQLYYQESIEEEIAEMPVRATLPLICTFAGLLMFFLVPPFLQVISILTENMPGGQ